MGFGNSWLEWGGIPRKAVGMHCRIPEFGMDPWDSPQNPRIWDRTTEISPRSTQTPDLPTGSQLFQQILGKIPGFGHFGTILQSCPSPSGFPVNPRVFLAFGANPGSFEEHPSQVFQQIHGLSHKSSGFTQSLGFSSRIPGFGANPQDFLQSFGTNSWILGQPLRFYSRTQTFPTDPQILGQTLQFWDRPLDFPVENPSSFPAES